METFLSDTEYQLLIGSNRHRGMSYLGHITYVTTAIMYVYMGQWECGTRNKLYNIFFLTLGQMQFPFRCKKLYWRCADVPVDMRTGFQPLGVNKYVSIYWTQAWVLLMVRHCYTKKIRKLHNLWVIMSFWIACYSLIKIQLNKKNCITCHYTVNKLDLHRTKKYY